MTVNIRGTYQFSQLKIEKKEPEKTKEGEESNSIGLPHISTFTISQMSEKIVNYSHEEISRFLEEENSQESPRSGMVDLLERELAKLLA